MKYLKPSDIMALYKLPARLKRLLKEHGIDVVEDERKIDVIIKRVKIDE